MAGAQERYRDLFENAVAGIFRTTVGGRLLAVNRAGAQMLGYGSPAEMLAEIRDAKSAWVEPKHRAELIELLQSKGVVSNYEYLARRRDGTVVWLSLNARAVRDPDIAETLIEASVVDVTRRHEAEQELRTSREQYRALFEHMVEGVAHCRMLFDDAGEPVDWVYVDVNAAFGPLTGVQNVVGRRATEVIPGIRDTNRDLFAIYGRVARTGTPEQLETYVPGLERWFSIKVFRPQPDHVAAVFENITARKRADDELRESEERYRTLVEQSSDAVFVLDPDGRIVEANTTGGRMLGYQVDDLVARHWAELVAPADLLVRPLHFTELRSDTSLIFERELRRRDGTMVPVELSAKVLSDGRLLHVARDTTQRVRAEAERARLVASLRRTQEDLEEAQQIARVGSWTLDPATGDAAWSPEMYRIIGLDPDGPAVALGDISRLFTPDSVSLVTAAVERAIRDGEPWRLDLEIARPDGARGWVTSYGIAERDDTGVVARIRGTMQDVTEQRRAQEELRLAHARLRRLIDANVVGIMIARANGEIVEANDYYLDLIGYTRAELEHGEVDWRVITPQEWLPADEQAIRELRERGVCAPYEKEYVLRDGRRVPVFLADTILPGPDEQIAAFVLDISDRRRAEREVLALNAELEERVRLRTAALEAANRELEAFSYSVSHDLRAPLRAIDGFGQILLNEHAGQLDAEARRVLGIVVRNTKRMGALIDDLLAFSRVALKQLERRPVDMEGLARSVAEELKDGHPARPIEFDIGPLCSAPGDMNLLRQVWENLIGNAVKFTRPVEHPRIEVRCERIDAACHYTVRDNGVGYDPAYGGQLFQPFQRLHRSSDFEGTGIGLAIVARIVQRHGGRVWAEGATGSGATFGFSLPDKTEAT